MRNRFPLLRRPGSRWAQGRSAYNPLTALPSLLRYWSGDVGVAKTGANVDTWTDQVASSVLTASGTGISEASGLLSFAGTTARLQAAAAEAALSVLHDGTGGTVLLDLVTAHGGGTEGFVALQNWSTTDRGLALRQEASGRVRAFFGNGPANVADLNSGAALADGRHTIAFRYASAQAVNLSLVVDGAAYDSDATENATPSTAAPADALTLGNRSATTNGPLSGGIRAVAICGAYLSDDELAAWRAHRLEVAP